MLEGFTEEHLITEGFTVAGSMEEAMGDGDKESKIC
jgi:hypothetical protein